MVAWLVAIVGSIAGFLFGYDEGIIAGSLTLVTKHFSLDPTHVGVMTSALPFGAFFGSMLIGLFLATRMMKRVGRRPILALAGVLFLLGSLGTASATVEPMLIICRFLLGLAIGVASVVTPLYLAETAPVKLRGAMVAIYQLAITLGILCAYCVNYLLIEHAAWRMMFASSAIPASLLILGMFFLPESPRWLVSIGQYGLARKVLERLHSKDSSESIVKELYHIEATLAKEPKNSSWRDLFTRSLRPVLFLGVMLFCLQQLSGINVIIYYAPEIFKNLGFENTTGQILATMGIGLVNMLVTVAAVFSVDKLGRRKLLLIGFAGTCVSLGVLSICSLLNVTFLAYCSVICLTMYIFSFAISLGPIPHIAMSEIFPLHVRGAGMGLSSISNWGFNTLTVFSFPLLQQSLGIELTFGIYAIVCFLGLIYTYYKMPETKNLSLEDIEDHLMSGQTLASLGREVASEDNSGYVAA